MVVTIGTYAICNGTLAGGVAISDLREQLDNIVDVAMPIGNSSPSFFDRIVQRCGLRFLVKRVHASNSAAEDFILGLDNALPSTGTIVFKTTGPTPASYKTKFGKIVRHSLREHDGATTIHEYEIIGEKLSKIGP